MTEASSPTAEEQLRQDPWDPKMIAPLVDQLTKLHGEMRELELKAEPLLKDIAAERQASVRNLLHYVALRHRDIRELQEQLVLRGLSSLGRCEAYVMSNVEAVLRILHTTQNLGLRTINKNEAPVSFEQGRARLATHTHRLFGFGDREPPIMVTLPSEAADDFQLVRDLLSAGMSVMRINCAHDDRSAWSAMIQHLRRAESETGRSCRIAMDLAGPKIRTGPIEPGAQVLRWKPQRNEYGVVVAPARIWISPNASKHCPADCDIAVQSAGAWWQSAQVGDKLRFDDAAGRRRTLKVTRVDRDGLVVGARKSARVTPETVFHLMSTKAASDDAKSIAGQLTAIPQRAGSIILRKGDPLVITSAETVGRPAEYDSQERMIAPARIGCTLPEIFHSVKTGDRILLDDGKIAGVIEEASESQLIARIHRAREKGDRLRSDKGINFPDTKLDLPALTASDVEDLEFIASHADIVSYSFVRRPEDIRRLHDELRRLNRPELGIILKIENRQAFDNLPLLLLEVMRCSPATGVMIARGDLAVECGWERLVELQEEILWMCEAAHLPVVWATQVLEGLAKTGLPTRAEVTDAGMGARAECVMLNKGPNIVETVRTLHDILLRMQQHQVKKRSTFRRLNVAGRLLEQFEGP